MNLKSLFSMIRKNKLPKRFRKRKIDRFLSLMMKTASSWMILLDQITQVIPLQFKNE